MNIANQNARAHSGPPILLVDDEEDILPEYQDFLEFKGLDSLICADPEQAVAMVLEQPSLRLVITDLRMAKLDGASLIRTMRSTLPPSRHVDFIILTGDATIALGDDIADVPVFIKPADTNALVAEIRTKLARTP